jgi:hypothetical protein
MNTYHRNLNWAYLQRHGRAEWFLKRRRRYARRRLERLVLSFEAEAEAREAA